MGSPVNLPPGAVLDKAALPPGAVLDAPAQEKPGALSQIGTSLKNQAKGIFDTLATLVDPVMAQKMGNGIIDASSEQWDKAKAAAKQGNYGEAMHRALTSVPIVGPMVQSIIDKAPDRPYEAATDLAVPALLGAAGAKGGGIVDAAGDAITNARNATARGLMKSALKPGVADAPTLADVRSGVDTALQNQIPVTEAGAGKLSSLIADYGRKTQAVIDARAQQGGTVNPSAVASRLDQINTSQVLPEKDIATINKAKQAFMERNGAAPAQPPTPTGVLDANGQPVMRPGAPANPGNPIPVDVAQAEKQGTYRQNAAKYGELSQAQIEAEKALARGYREELEAQAPELKLLNQKESEFLGLQPMLERAVRRAGNADVVDFKTLAETGAGAVAAGPLGAAAGLTTRILDFPGLKSRLAIAISKASNKTGNPLGLSAANARAAAIIGSLGSAAANNQPEEMEK